ILGRQVLRVKTSRCFSRNGCCDGFLPESDRKRRLHSFSAICRLYSGCSYADRGGGASRPSSRGPVTITDVARLAGVSPGTASKALNGRGGISADTAERVRQAADRLGYPPTALARRHPPRRHLPVR